MWLAAIATGLLIAALVAWRDATDQVDRWIAAPPLTTPGVVYSAPLQPRVGLPATADELLRLLLAAGYTRSPEADQPGQVARQGDRLVVHSAADPSLGLPEVRAIIELGQGRIQRVQPAEVRLAPVVLATVGSTERRRDTVHLERVSPWLEPAVLAMEDSRFRDHLGIDPVGVLRALWTNLRGDDGLHGGSTLTQQLAKNLFLSPERTLRRKLREASFAAALESRLDKDALLELYLGEVYLGQLGGQPIHGVEQASRAWFGVSAADLDLAQAATIAGAISAPNASSPLRNPERARQRRNLVLDRLEALGEIDPAAADAARSAALEVGGLLPGARRRAPYAVDAIIDLAERSVGRGGLARSGYRVHSTIQPLVQRAAERAVERGMAELDEAHPEAAGAQVALVALRVADGAVVALIGGRDYATSQFDRASHGWRQVGSTVKPLTLLAAFEEDPSLGPMAPIEDRPIVRQIDGRSWSPSNYDGRYLGEISLRRSIELSRNIPAVLLAEQVGWSDLQRHLQRAGLSRATRMPSVALGAFDATPLELAGAYTALPGQGRARRPYLVAALDTTEGSRALTPPRPQERLASSRAAGLATTVLEGVIDRGTGAAARRLGVQGAVGGKTGTTNNYRDAWFVGFTSELVVAVWVGHDRGASLGLTGSQAALPTWAHFVSQVQGGQRFATPRDLEEVQLCASSHRLARPSCPSTYVVLDHPDTGGGLRCEEHGGPLVEAGRSLRRLWPFGRRDRPPQE